MNWLSRLKLVENILNGGRRLAQVFIPDKTEGQSQRAMTRQTIEQNDAGGQQVNRNWWDSFIDGINRLPRPLFALSLWFMFVIAFVNPLKFSDMMRALDLVPSEMWWISGIIIGFYFVAREGMKMHVRHIEHKQKEATRKYFEDKENGKKQPKVNVDTKKKTPRKQHHTRRR